MSIAQGFISAVLLAGCGLTAPDLSLPPADKRSPGPVVARVGSVEICQNQVADLARLANQLRDENGLPKGPTDGFGQRLELAVELMALAIEAGDRTGVLKNETDRLLARVYLERLMSEPENRPVTRRELEEAHQREVQKYLATRESDIYRPTQVDLLAVKIGHFPDFHSPEDDQQPVLARAGIEDLAGRIRAIPAHDLDGFLAGVRRLMVENPTLTIQRFPRVHLEAEPFEGQPVILRARGSLEKNGSLSPTLWTGGGAWILRRGATYPGRGERPEEVKSQLADRVVQRRKRRVYQERRKALREHYRIQTWPRRALRMSARERSLP